MAHPLSPEIWPDPYPTYRDLAESTPLYADAQSGMTFMFRYADADALLHDRTVSNAQDQRRRDDPLPGTMLNTDPPEHTRLRAAAAPLIGAAAGRELESQFDAELSALVAELERTGAVDAVSGLGRPFATVALAVLLGLSATERAQFSMLIPAASANLDPLASPALLAKAAQASEALAALLAHRATGAAGNDSGSPLGRFWNGGELTEDERVSTLMLIVVGAWEPLANLGATGTSLLAKRPELLAQLAGSREDVAAFVDEVLRLESPIPFVARQLTQNVALPSGTITAPAHALVMLGAANRDPAKFAEPDELRLDRGPARHVAFGAGVHRCPGAPLVRDLGARLFSALARAFALIQPRDPDAVTRWRPSIVPRGLAEHWVSFTPRTP